MVEDIVKRLEKLECFKKDTIADISDLDTKLEYMTNDLDMLMRKNLKTSNDANIENTSLVLISDEGKNAVVKEFLETHLDISQEVIEEIREIPLNKRQDFQLEDLDDNENVYWACRILLDYIKEPDSKEWQI